MRRLMTAMAAATFTILAAAGPTLACGGLIGPNGAVNLLRTTTFAGYHAGVEHYITAFQFAGGGGAFGSITPLPGVPTDVVKGGDWTLQRLVRETQPLRLKAVPEAFAAASLADEAQVILQTKIDALDITVLKGGADEVGLWAKNHGFRLPPDAPAVLDFYAQRSPIFMAASFDADAAKTRGQQLGDGTPVHITIPTTNPWVPLRILGLGKSAEDRITADVYLMTDARPAMLPLANTRPGVTLTYNQAASSALLTDLRTDRGMGWVPENAWLSQLSIDAKASELNYDLAVDASGQNAPSRLAAGLSLPNPTVTPTHASVDISRLAAAFFVVLVGVAAMAGLLARRGPSTPSAPAGA
jgi:hypothetical protein